MKWTYIFGMFKTWKQHNVIQITFITCLQDHTREFEFINCYGWEWLKGCIPSCFMQFWKKFNLKYNIWCIIMYKKCTGQPKINQIRSLFYNGFNSKFSEYFELTFSVWLQIYVFVHVGSVIRRRILGGLYSPSQFFFFRV